MFLPKGERMREFLERYVKMYGRVRFKNVWDIMMDGEPRRGDPDNTSFASRLRGQMGLHMDQLTAEGKCFAKIRKQDSRTISRANHTEWTAQRQPVMSAELREGRRLLLSEFKGECKRRRK